MLLQSLDYGIYDDLVFDLEGVGAREVLVGPDRETADPLVLRKLSIRPV